MNDKQRLFVVEYVRDFNASAAYKRAGYRAKGAAADVNASRLLRKAEISSAIAAATASVHAKAGLSVDKVIKQLERMVMYDARKLFHPDGSPKAMTELDDDTAAVIAGIEVVEDRNSKRWKYKLTDRLGAVITTLKMHGKLSERHEHTGKDGGPIEIANDLEIARRMAFVLTKHTPKKPPGL